MDIKVPIFHGPKPASQDGTFLTEVPWNPTRPRILVIACSDGRLQRNLDDFLEHHLGITDYDRIYIAGGPGALSSSGYDFLRGDQLRRDGAFLIEAHEIEEVVLIFHSAAANGDASDGPVECLCADYRRKFPDMTPAQVNAQQVEDYHDLKRRLFDLHPRVRVRSFRSEVMRDTRVRFVPLPDATIT